ncbi:MAG: cyclic nucleotide-binding domain-containing protein [Acidobacteria bacterium]|nr:cyclic nucleotide-binding domain-containing protein [Acidobacteriota bacterium]
MKDFAKYKVGYKRGDRIFTESDAGENMYIVHSGRVRIFRVIGGLQVDLALFEKGDFFGEMAMFEHRPRSACAEAVEETELLNIDPPTFADMIRANPEIAVRMMRKYSIRLREANRKIEELATLSHTLAGVEDIPAPRSLPTPPPPLSAAAPHATLVVEGSGRSYPILQAETQVGRMDHVTGLKPEVDLSAEDVSRHISRRHARITYREDRFYLSEEIGAMNGTFLNGEKISQQGVLYPLEDGDRITLCQLHMIFRVEPSATSTRA